MNRIKIKQIQSSDMGKQLKVCGWVRTVRKQKNFAFIELNDGSTLSNLQILFDETAACYEDVLQQLSTGASIQAIGLLTESLGQKQKWELKAKEIHLFGTCPEDYPLQKKRHSFEFLREIAHLRPRTNTQGAIMRLRNALAFATHLFFSKETFYMSRPLL